MTNGGCRRQPSFADRWIAATRLRSSTKPTLAKVRIRSGWMTSNVLVTRRAWPTAHIEVLDNTTVTTVKMQLLYAQVTKYITYCHDDFEELWISHLPALSTNRPENVRLVDGTDSCSGRLEVFHNDKWGRICSNNWGSNEATMVCKELNCGAPKKNQERFGAGGSELGSYTCTCSGNVSSIAQCRLQEQSGTCESVSVSCAGKRH